LRVLCVMALAAQKMERRGHQIVRVVGGNHTASDPLAVFDTRSGKGRPMWFLLAGASIVIAACVLVARATVHAVADIASGPDTLG
jgi:hypothetical protein